MCLEASAKDPESMELLKDWNAKVTEGALILANLFSPQKLIITTNECDILPLQPLIKIVKEELSERLFSLRDPSDLAITSSSLRGKGVLLGGVVLAINNKLLN